MMAIDNSFADLADSIADWDPDSIAAGHTGRCCRSTASPVAGTDIEDLGTIAVDTDRTSFVDK